MTELTFPKYGDNVIPPNRTKLEFDLYRLIRGEFQDIPIPYRTFLKPMEISGELLPFLSWTVNVNLWKSSWSEEKKRSVTARSFELHSLKGTEEGIRQHVAIMDGEVVQVVKPPQGFFIGPDLTKQQWDDFIRQQPELRVSVERQRGEQPVGMFLDVGFMDDEFAMFDDGLKLYGRKIVLRKGGVDTQLNVFTQLDDVQERVSREILKTSLIGHAPDGLFLDAGFLDQQYLDGEAETPRIVTLNLNRTYAHVDSRLQLTLLEPGFEPLDPRYERVSDIGDAGPGLFLDHDSPDDAYILDDLGYLMLADRVYLNDPQAVLPLVDGLGFLDHTRIEIPPYYAEMMIEAQGRASDGAMYLDVGFLDNHGAIDEDTSKIDDVCKAIEVSSSLRDKILVTFETTRPLSLLDGIPLAGNYRLDDRIPSYL